ncbi:hypothetical protein CBL_12242 [Carabus blaptoides fortunei]
MSGRLNFQLTALKKKTSIPAACRKVSGPGVYKTIRRTDTGCKDTARGNTGRCRQSTTALLLTEWGLLAQAFIVVSCIARVLIDELALCIFRDYCFAGQCREGGGVDTVGRCSDDTARRVAM